jgi:hypothetical protein
MAIEFRHSYRCRITSTGFCAESLCIARADPSLAVIVVNRKPV